MCQVQVAVIKVSNYAKTCLSYNLTTTKNNIREANSQTKLHVTFAWEILKNHSKSVLR